MCSINATEPLYLFYVIVGFALRRFHFEWLTLQMAVALTSVHLIKHIYPIFCWLRNFSLVIIAGIYPFHPRNDGSFH